MADNFRHAAGEDWKQLGIWYWIPQLTNTVLSMDEFRIILLEMGIQQESTYSAM